MHFSPKQTALFLATAAFIGTNCTKEFVAATPQDKPGRTALSTEAPRLHFRVSGNLGGYLMPCGCASGQMGGLARRAFRNKIDARNIDVLLEGGNLIKKPGELEYSKLITALEVLSQGAPNYRGIGLSSLDLTLPYDDLTPLLGAFPFIASDLVGLDGKAWMADGEPVASPFQEVTVRDQVVRIGSLTMSLPKGEIRKKVKLLDPAAGWARAMKGAPASTYRVAMIHAEGKAIKALTLTPRPDLIVAISDDYVEPPQSPSDAQGVPLVFVGEHGRFLVDVTIARGPTGAVITKYAPVPLKGSRTALGAMRDATALAVIQGHRETVKEDGMLERLANKTPLPGKARYIGAKECAECHDDESTTCAPHAHSHAWQTLVDAEKREKWPVTSYPECVSCHVVGYGYQSGFVSPKKTPHLLNVTCENCHGPGSEHAASGGDVAMPLGKPGVSSCTQCHNFEHSPKFDYTSYWKKIVHGK